VSTQFASQLADRPVVPLLRVRQTAAAEQLVPESAYLKLQLAQMAAPLLVQELPVAAFPLLQLQLFWLQLLLLR
jgi:hypothetical protein